MSDLDVAPFTGAWIETEKYWFLNRRQRVAPFTGAWIETARYVADYMRKEGRTLYGCVD